MNICPQWIKKYFPNLILIIFTALIFSDIILFRKKWRVHMNVIIHDLENILPEQIFTSGDRHIVSDNGCIKNCIGCFGCWIKTPGVCVLKDGYENMGELLSKAGNVIIISRCYYGGYSPFVKNVLDRSISYLLPFFTIKKNETHHKQRYKSRFRLYVYFYGENISKNEAITAKKLVQANCTNFNVPKHEVLFFNSIEQLCKKVKTQWK